MAALASARSARLTQAPSVFAALVHPATPERTLFVTHPELLSDLAVSLILINVCGALLFVASLRQLERVCV